MITPMNQLPVVVDAPGIYVMRNGGIAEVIEIKEHTRLDTTAFSVRGYVRSETKTGRRRRRYTIWHVSGRHKVLELSRLDLIRKGSAE